MDRTLYVLVGNIASGKSTYLKDKVGVIISKDDIRKTIARSVHKDYIFDYTIERNIFSIVEELMYSYCYVGAENIYIDEINMTVDSREMYINIAKNYEYNCVAVVFPDYGEDIHVRRRLRSNRGSTSEEIWRDVYRRNKSKFEIPIFEEGFDEVIYI